MSELLDKRRVSIFAHFDKENIIQDYVLYYLKELKKVSDKIIFVSDCNLPEKELNKIEKIVTHYMAQKHGEYDFGSYKRGFLYAKENSLFENCDELIFCNDSCYGPLYPFSTMFDAMDTRICDFWGATYNSRGICQKDYPHIQSFFIVFKPQIFKSDLFLDFMKNIKKENCKDNIIIKYEIGLTEYLNKNGFKESVYSTICYKHTHSHIFHYLKLILIDKCPFIKTSIIRRMSNHVRIMRFIKKYTNYNVKLISKDLKKMHNITKKNNLIENIFSIKNSLNKKHKIITFLGIKISIRNKLIHHLFSITNKQSSNKKWHKIIYVLGIKISVRNKNKERLDILEDKNNQLIQERHYYTQSVCLPNIKINNKRRPSVNIFIPQINKRVFTAGPLGILFFGKYLSKNGIHVRFFCEPNEFAPKDLNTIEGLDYILKNCSFETYDGNSIIEITENDINIATFWSTAYVASHIQQHCKSKKFIYLIQDYEKIFYPNSFLAALAENTYDLDYLPIFSTDILKNFFYENNIGMLKEKKVDFAVFDTASSSFLPSFNIFCKRTEKKNFVYYGRPNNPRNCYEMGMDIIKKLIDDMVLLPQKWNFYSIGNNNVETNKIYFSNDVYIQELPYISADEYKKGLYKYDLCLSLMMSPHPSMIPIDMALSGVPIVTNTYKNKTEKSLKNISQNIYSSKLNELDLYGKVKEAIKYSDNLDYRYKCAKSSYPQNWNACFGNNMNTILDYIKCNNN